MSVFKFKQFDVHQNDMLHKVGTDAMVLGAFVQSKLPPKHILDIGTGTGVISLMLAQQFPAAHITGIDVDSLAVETAKLNVYNSPFSDRIEIQKADFLTFTAPYQFDVIVSNPPYFNTHMFSADQQRNLARHENNMTISKLLEHSVDFITKKGNIWLILPHNRIHDITRNLSSLHLIRKIEIFGKPDKPARDILVFSKHKTELVEETLTIRTELGKYTPAYKALTSAFHYNKL